MRVALIVLTLALTLAAAAGAVIGKVGALGGTGGLIAIDRDGNIALPFNTTGMYRGYVDVEGKTTVAIYKERGQASL